MVSVRIPGPTIPIAPSSGVSVRSLLLLVLPAIIFLCFGFCFRYMSRPIRKLPDVDYKILGSTGDRVKVVRVKQNSNMDEYKTKAIYISSDVDDLFDSYVLEEMNGEEELQNYVDRVDALKRDFRRVHTVLKRGDEENFADTYPDYDENLRKLTESFKTATKKLSNLRAESKATADQREAAALNSQKDEKKLRCMSERKFFINQTTWELDCEWDKISDLDALKTLFYLFF